jgi:hypothetical protein
LLSKEDYSYAELLLHRLDGLKLLVELLKGRIIEG